MHDRFIYHPPAEQTFEVLFDDPYLLAINKPAGLLSVPGRLPEHQDSLTNRVQTQWDNIHVIHRLDMATSGIMLFARTIDIQRQMHRYFAQRQVQKTYQALVHGCIQNPQGIIDLPLLTDWPNRPKQKVDLEHGKAALTHYHVLGADTQHHITRLELKPITGRSHQLRVHLLSIGHAICGDRLYTPANSHSAFSRMMLHANRLSFMHPHTQQLIQIESVVPF